MLQFHGLIGTSLVHVKIKVILIAHRWLKLVSQKLQEKPHESNVVLSQYFQNSFTLGMACHVSHGHSGCVF